MHIESVQEKYEFEALFVLHLCPLPKMYLAYLLQHVLLENSINQNYILGLIYNISSNFYESEGDIIDFASRVKNHENKTSLDILQEQFDCRLFKIKINEYTESSVIEVSTKIAKFIYSPIEEIINKQDNLRITNLN